MNNIKTNSFKAWMLAARPKTLAGAAVPVLIGCGLAYSENVFQLIPSIICFLFAFVMQIDANFINDYFDFKKGDDREDRLGPERACAQGWITLQAMKKGITITSILACSIGSCILFYADSIMIIVGLLCVLFAFLYTTRLGHLGLGDILVLIFFGLVPVCGTFYVMAHSLTWEVIIASLACGLVIDTLLMVNNYRDREQDKKSNKRTIVVRYGEKAGQQLYLLLGITGTGLCLFFIPKGHIWAAFLPQLYLIFHLSTWKEMAHICQGKKLNIILGKTSRNMLLFGILLTLGFILK
ncbi:MAG: 1,4-dihydroxy-2-naphthoate octaprenyltransferase [Phocaeicola sp.]|uniref:1,4-dihydroxy-2-naphthoate octaprenyltransferase n=2 Tax=Phocaeicola sp. TaxID=2773926 RepID=UPI003F9EC029